MKDLETKTIIESPAQQQVPQNQQGLLDSYAGHIVAGTVILAFYLSRISLYRWEMSQNIVNGAYAKLLENKKSDFLHRFYLLGKPNEVIRAGIAHYRRRGSSLKKDNH